jgi:hypothetical protein
MSDKSSEPVPHGAFYSGATPPPRMVSIPAGFPALLLFSGSNSHLSPPAISSVLMLHAHLSRKPRTKSAQRQVVSRQAKSSANSPEGTSADRHPRGQHGAGSMDDRSICQLRHPGSASEGRQSSSVYEVERRINMRSNLIPDVHGRCVGGAVKIGRDRSTTPGDRCSSVRAAPVYASSFASISSSGVAPTL